MINDTTPCVCRYKRVRRPNGQMAPVGLVCAQYDPITQLVFFGFSKKHSNDRFNKKMARTIAFERMASEKYAYKVEGAATIVDSSSIWEDSTPSFVNEVATVFNSGDKDNDPLQPCKVLKRELAWVILEAYNKAQYYLSHPRA